MLAQVVAIEWQDPSTQLGDDGLNMWIIHPGYGEVIGNGV